MPTFKRTFKRGLPRGSRPHVPRLLRGYRPLQPGLDRLDQKTSYIFDTATMEMD